MEHSFYQSVPFFELTLINNTICAVCKEGYYGINCKLKCRFPSYGLACQQKCTCMEKDCDHVKGCLLSAKGKLSIKADMLRIDLKGHLKYVSLYRQTLRVPC